MNLRKKINRFFFSSSRNILYLIIYTKSNLFLIKPIEKFQIMPLKKYYGLLLQQITNNKFFSQSSFFRFYSFFLSVLALILCIKLYEFKTPVISTSISFIVRQRIYYFLFYRFFFLSNIYKLKSIWKSALLCYFSFYFLCYAVKFIIFLLLNCVAGIEPKD